MVFEGCVDRMGRSPRRVHVRWVKHNTVYGTVFIRQIAAIYSVANVSGEQLIQASGHVPPEDTQTIRDISDRAAGRNVETQNLRENIIVPAHGCTEYQVISRFTILHSPSFHDLTVQLKELKASRIIRDFSQVNAAQ